MKKTIFSLLAILISLSASYTQSPLPIEGMETWDDYTELFKEYETSEVTFPDSMFLVPSQTQPFTHLVFILFGIIDVPAAVDSIPLERLQESLLGVDRYEPGHQGDYALKIGGGTLIPYSTLVLQADIADDMNPASFSYYYKHIGNSKDTFHVFATFGETVDSLTSENFPNDGISLYFENYQYFDEDESDYTWVTVPIEENNLSVISDSIFMFAGFFQENISTSSYLLLDGFQWDVETATKDENNEIIFRVGQAIDNRSIFPYLNQSKYEFVSSAIINENGSVLSTYKSWQDVISIEHLPQGKYFYQVLTKKGLFAKTFIRM